MENIKKEIKKYIKEEIDIFEDGEYYTTYTEIIYVLKSVRQIPEKEYLAKNRTFNKSEK